MTNAATRTNSRSGGAAFTVVELLVVITITILALVVAVPAFTSALESAERSSAENSLRVALTVARDTAFARLDGRDAGLFVVRDRDGLVRLVPAVEVGVLEDAAVNPFGAPLVVDSPRRRREVFAPLALAQNITLPRGWLIAGYAAPGTLQGEWFANPGYTDFRPGTAGPSNPAAATEGNWLLPETGFYEIDEAGAPPSPGALVPRQTFFVRFRGGDGELISGGAPVILADPRPSTTARQDVDFPNAGLAGDLRGFLRADRADEVDSWAVSVLLEQNLNSDTGVGDSRDATLRAQLVGAYSNDTVVAGAVTRLALFEERDLLFGLTGSGAAENPDTRTLHLPYDEPEVATQAAIEFDLSLFGGTFRPSTNDGVRRAINAWVWGDTAPVQSDQIGDGIVDPDNALPSLRDRPLAQLFFIQPQTGELTEVDR